MSEVIYLPVKVHGEHIDAGRVFDAAKKLMLQDVLILGSLADGRFYCASSMDAAKSMLHLEKARIEILKSLGPL